MPSLPISAQLIRRLRVAATTTHAFALITSIYRLVYRLRISRFSWDDSWALVAVVFDVALVCGLWLSAFLTDHQFQSDSIPHYRTYRKVAFWIMSMTFLGVVCSCRLSLACSIGRIITPSRTKTILICLEFIFFIFWVILVCNKIRLCTNEHAWTVTPLLDCTPGQVAGILEIVNDVFSSITLVLLAAYIINRMNLPQRERKLIIILFMTSFLTLVACLIHAVYVFDSNTLVIAFTAHFEAAISLLVCNLLVVVTSLYRHNLFRCGATFTLSQSEAQPQEQAQPTIQITTSISEYHQYVPPRMTAVEYNTVTEDSVCTGSRSGRGTSVSESIRGSVSSILTFTDISTLGPSEEGGV